MSVLSGYDDDDDDGDDDDDDDGVDYAVAVINICINWQRKYCCRSTIVLNLFLSRCSRRKLAVIMTMFE